MKRLFLLFLTFLFASSFLLAQRTVTGLVTDQSGESLIGANILVKGTQSGSITDIDGSFTIEVPEGFNTLLVSFTGFETSEIDIVGLSYIDITLSEGELLDEVVVTGYTAQSMRENVSSIATVGADKLENRPVTDINQALQGNAPGVFTSANSGQPGAQQQIRIRGTGSINAGRNPLYVIDGIIIEQGNFSQNDADANQADILANLNPNDIESINVLKDASATSLYGARGSNGVIVINTKSGKSGDTKITVKSQYGTTSPSIGNFEMMNAQQQWDYERALLANSGFDAATIDGIRSADMLDNTTDWVDAAFRDGKTYNLELQASGGNEKTSFFLSGGYNVQEGTLIESDFDRASIRSNITHKATDRLKLTMNFNTTYSGQTNAVAGNRFASPLLGAFLNTPMQGATDPETGELYTGLEDDWIAFIGDNFLHSTPINYVDINTLRILSKIEASYKIIDGLSFAQNAAVDFIDLEETTWQDPTTNDGFNDNGYLGNSFGNFKTLTTQSKLNFTRDIARDHTISALGVAEYQRYTSNQFATGGRGFASGKLQTLNSAAEPDFVSGAKSNYSFISFITQATYGYKNKYYLTGSFTRNGSSRFGANNRWANFWSVGARWSASDEAFFDDIDLISNLSLRASYGTTGNADIGNFDSQELYSFGAAYLGNPGSTPAQIANPNLTWEQQTKFNVGIDFSLFKSGRIGGSVDYYRNESTDLLLDVPVSSTSGFTTATQNIGRLENTGIELVINTTPVLAKRAGDFNWDIDFNISWNDNKILELPEGEDINNGSQIIREGLPIRSVYMQQWAGVNPANGQPLWYTADDDGNINGVTSTYSQADRFVVGNAAPDFVAGLTNTFSFKNVSLSAFFYTAQGNEIYNSSRRFIESDGQRFGWNHLASAGTGYWQQEGDIVSSPQPLLGGNRASNSQSTRYLEDASFVRLRNITLGYSLPSSLLDKMNISGLQFYVQGQNLWTLTDYSGFDPEADENGSEFFRYPVGKSVTFGLDFTF